MTADAGSARVETVTVMFTDLVDSTAIRVRVGEEEAERLRERHDRLVRAAVVASLGRVAKHTGDGVMAIFSGASDAISAAVSVQQEIEADGRSAPSAGGPLQVRIGISAGDVTTDGEDCFGLPVIEAQRLEAAAQPGQILISTLVSALARGRGAHEVVTVGSLDLKGLDAPVDAQEVRWSPRPAEAVALPPGLTDRGAFRFAGRDKESELILGAWASATTGATPLVLVSGEPGIGKTRLAAQVATVVLDKGGTVLAGRCDELVGAPYQPFSEALRHQVSRPGGADHLGPAPAELTRLFPELAAVVPGLPEPLAAGPEAERLRMFEAVRGWLADVASDGAVLLVLDDLHWADGGTLLLLRHVIATEPVPGLLVVGTYRDTDLERTSPLSGMLGELRRRSEVTRVVLDGLEPTEVTDLMSLAAGHELEEDAVALALDIQAETGGNPFFVGEVLRHLAESGAIVYSSGRWRAGRGGDDRLLPEGIRDVVGRRLSALPESTQSALATAAVIGVDFDLDVLAAVAGTPDDQLIDALEPALTAHLLVETGVGRYRFSHALVRSTLHGELSTTRRARLHRVVAETLEALHGSDLDAIATELAYHWAEAGPATAHEHAITYARRAAELAWRQPAPDEAARWYRQARELLDGADPALDAELAALQVHAEMLAGTAGWQQTQRDAARAAERLGDPRLMATTLCLSNRSVLTEDSPEPADLEKIALLERALELAADDPALTAELSGALAFELMFTGDRARRAELVAVTQSYASTVEDLLERHRLGRLAGRARSFASIPREQFEVWGSEWDQGVEIARLSGDRDIEAQMRSGQHYLSLWLGRPGQQELVDKFAEMLETYPHPLHADELLLERLNLALIQGRLDDADDLTERLVKQCRAHGRLAEVEIYGGSGRLQAARERFGMAPLWDPLRAAPGPPGGGTSPTAGRGLIVLAAAEAGNVDEARAMLDRYGGQHFDDLSEDSARPVALSTFAEAAALVRHEQACRDLLPHLLPLAWAHQTTGGWYLGATSRYLGLVCDALDRTDEADEWFAQAEAEHEIMQTPPWLARGRLDWAESLLRRGEAGRAAQLAQSALSAIGDLDLAASRARAERVLTAARSR